MLYDEENIDTTNRLQEQLVRFHTALQFFLIQSSFFKYLLFYNLSIQVIDIILIIICNKRD